MPGEQRSAAELKEIELGFSFETMGNAILLVRRDGEPLLVTDPWLKGTAYFGSWAHDRPLTEQQMADCAAAPFVWISHGHPDHLHPESLELLPRDKLVLLPDHYSTEIRDSLAGMGFGVEILRDKVWRDLAPGLRVLCVGNRNQDGILAIAAGDAILLNKNDSPFYGERAYFRRLMAKFPKRYLLSLCAIDADMLNIVDDEGRLLAGPPDERKRGTIWSLCREARYLGVQAYCSSSSQHIYVRGDSKWANPYRIVADDMRRFWIAPEIKFVEAYATVHLDDGRVVLNHPTQESNWAAVGDGTGDDDWNQRMVAEDWTALEAFVRKFETLRGRVDYIGFRIAGETRRFEILPGARRRPEKERGVIFELPRNSLMETVKWGYFDDLLIGNFMKTRLYNFTLYPDFSPTIAKIGGNAKVYTQAELSKFKWHYFRRSPVASVKDRLGSAWHTRVLPFMRLALRRLGLFRHGKRIFQRLRNLPQTAD